MEEMNRITLFLYPSLNRDNEAHMNEVHHLIEDLKLIVNMANDDLTSILSDSQFAYIRCMPRVDMEQVYNNIHELEEAKDVRICVVKYNDVDYEDCYNDICTRYQNNQLDISHLVGVKIQTEVNGIRFVQENDSRFDVLIETGLNELRGILVSIMLDMSVYHYFGLHNNIQVRKNFSEPKTKYILKSKGANLYIIGQGKEDIKYLPFPFAYIENLCGENTTEKKCKKAIQDLLVDYFEFIVECVCKKIKYDNNKQSTLTLDERNALGDVIETIDNHVRDSYEFNGNSQYIMAIPSTSLDAYEPDISNAKVFSVAMDSVDSKLESIKHWLEILPESLDNYKLYNIVIGG